MRSEDRVPEGVDVEQPSSARVYDYFLGGAHNFAADRRVAGDVLTMYPDAPRMARANRGFLQRVVHYLTAAGLRQFIDIGSGIPTVGHVHEIAQQTAPDARVVYVDIDPVAVAHSREILAGNTQTAVIQEDVRLPGQIMRHPEVARLLDLTQPVAVLAIALFHFVSHADDPAGIVSRLMGPLVTGSYLAVSHVTTDGLADDVQDPFRGSGIDVTPRNRAQVAALFEGLHVIDPGVVWVPLWHTGSPDDVYVSNPEASGAYGAVGRKVPAGAPGS